MAEELAAGHMRLCGFTDARRSRDGADGGIDVISNLAVAQVKTLAVPVGAPDVQRLRGAAHGATHALFYSASGYTVAAESYARTARVALFTLDNAGEVLPVNSYAQSLETNDDPSALAELESRASALRARVLSITTKAQSIGSTLVTVQAAVDSVSRSASSPTLAASTAALHEEHAPHIQRGLDRLAELIVALQQLTTDSPVDDLLREVDAALSAKDAVRAGIALEDAVRQNADIESQANELMSESGHVVNDVAQRIGVLVSAG